MRRLLVALLCGVMPALPCAASDECHGKGTYVLPETVRMKSAPDAEALIRKVPGLRSVRVTLHESLSAREEQSEKVIETNPRLGAEVCQGVPITLYVGTKVYQARDFKERRASDVRRTLDAHPSGPIGRQWQACGQTVDRLEPACEPHFVVVDQWPRKAVVPWTESLQLRLAYRPVSSAPLCPLAPRRHGASDPVAPNAIDELSCRESEVRTVTKEKEVVREVVTAPPAPPAGPWIAAGSALGLGGALAATTLWRRRIDPDETDAGSAAGTEEGLRLRIVPDVPRPPGWGLPPWP